MFGLISTTLARATGRPTDRSAIGIDVGARTIKAVQLAVPGGRAAAGVDARPRVVAAVCHPRPAGAAALTADEAREVAAALAQGGFVGRRAVAAAPGDATMLGPIDLPPRSSNAPLDQLARMEVARNNRCAPDSFELAWWELPASVRGRGTHALAVALPHAAADALLDALEPAGLVVESIDAAPAALARACRPAVADAGVTAILDLGFGPATLSFVYRGVLAFARRLPELGVGPVHAAIGQKLSVEPELIDYLLAEAGLLTAGDGPAGAGPAVEMPDEGRRVLAAFADALARELTLSFGYASTQYPDASVSKLLLAGGGAGIAGLAKRMQTVLGVETVPVAPTALAACDPGVLAACASPAMTTALGLALRGVTR